MPRIEVVKKSLADLVNHAMDWTRSDTLDDAYNAVYAAVEAAESTGEALGLIGACRIISELRMKEDENDKETDCSPASVESTEGSDE